MKKRRSCKKLNVPPEKIEEMLALKRAGLLLREIAGLTGIGFYSVKKILHQPKPKPTKTKPAFNLDREQGFYNSKDWYKVAGYTI